jgi:hypothetical protein
MTKTTKRPRHRAAKTAPETPQHFLAPAGTEIPPVPPGGTVLTIGRTAITNLPLLTMIKSDGNRMSVAIPLPLAIEVAHALAEMAEQCREIAEMEKEEKPS